MQTLLPLAGFAQGVQLVPQESGEVFALHSVPQTWYPVRQANSHAPFLHKASPFAGAVQGLQRAPQVAGAVSETQRSSQACCPAGQTPLQASPFGMQPLPAQSL